MTREPKAPAPPTEHRNEYRLFPPAVPRSKLGQRIGRLGDENMVRLGRAVLVFLVLARLNEDQLPLECALLRQSLNSDEGFRASITSVEGW
ncbi:MAG: hypothetical protein ACR2G7_00710 [Acidimicrobiales bacterium]